LFGGNKPARMKNVLITGDPERAGSLRKRFMQFGTDWNIEISDGDEDEDYADYDILFDVNLDDDPEQLKRYLSLREKPVFVSALKLSLSEAVYLSGERVKCKLFGFNALEAFMSDNLWELSLYRRFERGEAEQIMHQLGVSVEIVEDRVGLVKMRVIAAIINEACWTLQEGTASAEDIDLAMQSGTNYPHGPLAWCDYIGISGVFETLAAMYEDTKEERYRICPLLKRKYLRNETFFKPERKI
jgi:3-hydroxybutyryl-CoA dehydrogenase